MKTPGGERVLCTITWVTSLSPVNATKLNIVQANDSLCEAKGGCVATGGWCDEERGGSKGGDLVKGGWCDEEGGGSKGW